MRCAMMIGVAQVMGMQPILMSFFSRGRGICAATSLASPNGKNCAIAASAVPAPSVLRKPRHVVSVPKSP